MTCGAFEPGFRGGGLVRAVVQTVDNAPERIDLALVTRDRDVGTRDPYPGLSGRWVGRGRARVFYLDVSRPRQWLALWRELRRTRFDLLYVNSLWSAFSIVPVAALRLGLLRARRVLVAPHGEFSPGALSLKAGKKRLFLAGWAPVLRGLNVVWHACAEREAAEIRAICPWARVTVSPNQLSLPREPIPVTSVHDGPARLVFIGRISPKKNLTLVLAALAKVSTPVEFDIYGPIEDAGYWSRCQELTSRLPAAVRCEYRGELAPDKVVAAFADYDAFVFPTLGENFGYVIAESLSASCPVICSAETPWTELLAAGGGEVVPKLTPDDLAERLERIAAMSPTERLRARQAAGRAYRSWREGSQEPNILERVSAAW